MRFIVDADEIRRLGKRFRKLDLDNSGALSIDEFMSLPELQQNPLVQRVIDIFDADGNGEVDFKGLYTNCSHNQYSPRLLQILYFKTSHHHLFNQTVNKTLTTKLFYYQNISL